jgi:maltooligosyltrehalose trehalohydrolase
MAGSGLNGMTNRKWGAKLEAEGVRYAVWAPGRAAVEVACGRKGEPPRRIVLEKEEDGFFCGVDRGGREGDRYLISLDGGEPVADWASRWQPEGVFGPSAVVDPWKYAWKTALWHRPSWNGQVLYELHVGAFTPEGTCRAAIEKLGHVRELGATAVELMPLAECAGERGWSYDSVLPFAPMHAYGEPDDLRALIDACHQHGLAVVLDVVYNHIGAFGDVTDRYSRHFSHPESGEWGKGFNLDGEFSRPVRDLLLQNLRYWLDEFRVDGFRVDAAHAIRDSSPVHWLQEATALVRGAGGFMIAEDCRNCRNVLEPRLNGGWGFQAQWADDFHHSARVMHTRERESYYGCYQGTAPELVDLLNHGWLYRGRVFPMSGSPRGTECKDLPPEAFVWCISNHDQVGNRALGERLNHLVPQTSYRALSLFFCLVPYTPMLFMGQEWAASAPFLFFTDRPGEEGRKAAEGRLKEFEKNGLNSDPEKRGRMPDPQDPETFRKSKLDWNERGEYVHRKTEELYRDALQLRRLLFGGRNPPRGSWEASSHGPDVCLRYSLRERRVEVWLLETFRPEACKGKDILFRANPDGEGEGRDAVVLLCPGPAERGTQGGKKRKMHPKAPGPAMPKKVK